MIYIYDRKNNISVQLDGRITENLRKRGYTEITSTRGQVFQEHMRGVIDISLDIIYIGMEEYKKLKLIFLNSGDLYIEDDDTGQVFNKYLIKGDTLTLNKEEDLDNKEYYYKGTLTFMKK